jgi:hypothetical protein
MFKGEITTPLILKCCGCQNSEQRWRLGSVTGRVGGMMPADVSGILVA